MICFDVDEMLDRKTGLIAVESLMIIYAVDDGKVKGSSSANYYLQNIKDKDKTTQGKQ